MVPTWRRDKVGTEVKSSIFLKTKNESRVPPFCN